MSESGRLAVTEFLSGPRWGGPLVVRSSIRFLKEKELEQRELHCVAFETTDEAPWFWLAQVEQGEVGTLVSAGGGGGRGGDPVRNVPWVNLAGWWGPDMVGLGGRVVGEGATNARAVVMHFGRTAVVDNVESGIVAWLVSGSEPPDRYQVLDVRGAVLAEHSFP